MLVLSLFLQLGLHYSALHTGLALAPVAVGIAASSLIVPALSSRLGRHLLHVGLGVELLGVLGFAAVATVGTTDVAFAAAGLTSGLGLGLLFGPLIQSTLSVAGPDEVGSASGAINAVQQIATALGVAVLGTVFFAGAAPAQALVTGALVVAASCVVCAVVVLALPPTERNTAI
jgi:MFS family permease